MNNVEVCTYETALQESTKYFDGDELAARVFVDKYAMKDKSGGLLESVPSDMHARLAKELHAIEVKKFGKENAITEQEFFELFDHFVYVVPQGSILYGLGNTSKYVTLSNCYILAPPEDSYGGIMLTDEHIVQVSKRRGGAGTNLSKLRPAGAPTRNSSHSSTGVVSFAKRFSNTIREVGQSGRRGALSLVLDVHHPDIVSFSRCKADLTQVTGANIACLLSDDFLTAVENNTTYEQKWPIDRNVPEVSREVPAHDVWNEIVSQAHATAEPGVLFWDTVKRETPSECYVSHGFGVIGINPCAEITSSSNETCRLLVMNTLGYVYDEFTEDAGFDWATFYNHAKLSQRILDDIVDVELKLIDRIIDKINNDPEDKEIKRHELLLWKAVRQKCQDGRRCGVSMTAIADTMAAIGISYNSQMAIDFAERLGRTFKFACYESSIEMAEELGPFPIFDAQLEKDCVFFERFKKEICDIGHKVVRGADLMERMSKSGRRNITCTAISPSGSMSILTQTTSGIEPLFMMSSMRRKKGNPNDRGFRSDFVDKNGDNWMEFQVVHPQIKRWQQVTGNDNIKESPWYNNCADDIDYHIRIKIQAALQRHICNGISATINLPTDTSVSDIQVIYEEAWRAGLKGITVYRKGCRDGVILEASKVDAPATKGILDIERPKSLPCNVHHTTVQGIQYFVLVGLLDGKPYEVFAGKNGFIPQKIKHGVITRKRKNFYVASFDGTDDELSPITASTNEMEETITRLTSLGLRFGADMHKVVQQLEKVGENRTIQNFAKSIARVLKKYIPDGTHEGEKCPQCSGEEVVRQEGCVLCQSCGWSKCA